MSKEDYGYFVDFMKSGGFTDEEISQYGSEYFIQVRLFGQGKYIMIIGAVLFIIGVIILVITISKSRGPKPAPMAPQSSPQRLHASSLFRQTHHSLPLKMTL